MSDRDIAAELRGYVNRLTIFSRAPGVHYTMADAAQEIDRLKAENEKLRAALQGGNALKGNVELLEYVASILSGTTNDGSDMEKVCLERAAMIRTALKQDAEG